MYTKYLLVRNTQTRQKVGGSLKVYSVNKFFDGSALALPQ